MKLKETDQNVAEFIGNIESDKKREDALILLTTFNEISNFPAKMWYGNIIGFGTYHYVYKSGHEGNAPIVAFSPRKAKISLYLALDPNKKDELLSKFGKYTMGKLCIYVNKLADIDLEVLKEIIKESINYINKIYPEDK